MDETENKPQSIENQLEPETLSAVVGEIEENPTTASLTKPKISEDLSNIDDDDDDDNLEKVFDASVKVDDEKSSKSTEKDVEETFQVDLESKQTETPPLLLLESKSQAMVEDDSVFSGDLSTMPDQILAESNQLETEVQSAIKSEQSIEIKGLEQLESVQDPVLQVELERSEELNRSMEEESSMKSEPTEESQQTKEPELPEESEQTKEPELPEELEQIKESELPKESEQLDKVNKQSHEEEMEESEERHEDLDERTEHEIASNIEEQLREFDGSEDDISLDKQIGGVEPTSMSSVTRPEDIFGDDISGGGISFGTTESNENVDSLIKSDDKFNEVLAEVDSLRTPSSHDITGIEKLDTEKEIEKQSSIEESEEIDTTMKGDEENESDLIQKPTSGEIEKQTDDDNDNIDDKTSSGKYSPMDVDDKPPDSSGVHEDSYEDSLNKTTQFEDVDMRSAEDSKERSELLQEGDDPLSKSYKVDESEKPFDLKDDNDDETQAIILESENNRSLEAVEVEDELEKSSATNIDQEQAQKASEDTIEKDNEIFEKDKEVVSESTPIEEDGSGDAVGESENVKEKTVEEVTSEKSPLSLDQPEQSEKVKDSEKSSTAEQSDSTEIQKELEEPKRREQEGEIPDSIENAEEQDVQEIVQPEESEDICLLPDTEKELTGAEKEQAILARENAEKEAAEKNKEKRSGTRQSTPSEGTVNEEDQIGEDIETLQENITDLKDFEIKELNEDVKDEKCYKCRKSKSCRYKFRRNGEVKYLCDIKCVNSFRNASKEEYTLIARKVIITSTVQLLHQICVRCKGKKPCGFRFKDPDTNALTFICGSPCLSMFIGKNVEKYLVRRKKYIVEEMAQESMQKCHHCGETKLCLYFFKQDDDFFHICNEDCFNLMSKEEPDRYRLKPRRSIRVRDLGSNAHPSTGHTEIEPKIVSRTEAEAEQARLDREESFVRRCAQCFKKIEVNERTLHWETADFCNEMCLGKYQNVVGAICQMCKANVPLQSLGKYCVRFGFDIRQFCCTSCLDRFKKALKVCSYCHNDISKSKEGFLAPVGDKGQFKDFCSQNCLIKYDELCNPRKKMQMGMCAVCNNEKVIRVEIILDDREQRFCSNPCFSAFKFVNNIYPDQCGMCLKYFERKSIESYTIYQDKSLKVFCCKICMHIYVTLNRKIVPCQWCKVKKYNFDMIEKQCGPQTLMLCSLNCLTLYGVSLNAISMRQQKCDQCNRQATPQYHLTMSDASVRNFCTYQCVMVFQSQFGRPPWTLDSANDASASSIASSSEKQKTATAPFPTGLPKRIKSKAIQQQQIQIQKPLDEQSTDVPSTVPIISNVASLAQAVEGGNISDNVVIKPLRKGRTRVITPIRADSSISPQTTGEDDQPVVRLRSLRSGGGMQDTPKSSQKITTNSHTQTKPVQKKNVGINVSVDKEESLKADRKTKVVVLKPPPPIVVNKQTMCKPATSSKGITCRPHPCSVECQTDDSMGKKIIVPIPVPIYIPQPMYMYSAPFPVPVPIPLPIPIPIFIPTTRNSAEGIMKEIKKIQDKMPTDPFEAELLMMAEMVAGEKKKNESDSDSDTEHGDTNVTGYSGVTGAGAAAATAESSNSFGEDVLQMALKMATECDEPAVDLESAMQANTITSPTTTPGRVGVGGVYGLGGNGGGMQHIIHEGQEEIGVEPHQMIMIDGQRQIIRGRKRPISPVISPIHHLQQHQLHQLHHPQHHLHQLQQQQQQQQQLQLLQVQQRNNRLAVTPPNKRMKRAEPITPIVQQTEPTIIKEPSEKPDANMCLKYTFGVNAWRQWVMTKNADLEKSSIKRKPFKSELLQMTADELNYSLCLFVREVRKPNGSEYAPDTIYYLVLGIQQYLYENGRIDNIFTDPYYERFTDCLDEVAKKFSVLYNDSQYIVTRVEEEHLWECKQLGAHSPHVLLSTLMFFNTKHFNLTTVDEHMQLSFSHIMKHWKRCPPGAKTPGSRNVLLRFYPPQSGLEANPRKKKVYEQQENEENPLRCPVKLYEFYLSKCPESVKTRNDVFYLQPERSCVPDSPVWYSTQPLCREALCKMLHRVKMVKEINIALLTS